MEGRIDTIFRLSKEISDKLDRFMLYVPPPPESAKNIVTKVEISTPDEPAPKVCLTPQVLKKTSERIDHLTSLVRAKELLPSRAGFSPLTDENLEVIRQIEQIKDKYKGSLSPRAIELIDQFYFKTDENKQVIRKYGYPVLSGDVAKSKEDREAKIIVLAKGNPMKGEKELNLLEKYILGPDIFEIWLSTTIIMKLLSPGEAEEIQKEKFREFLELKHLDSDAIFKKMKINKAVEAYFDAALNALEQSGKDKTFVNPFSLIKRVDKIGPGGNILKDSHGKPIKESVPNEDAFEKIRKIFEDNGMPLEDQSRILNYFKDDTFTDEFAELQKENETELIKIYNDFLEFYRKQIFDFKVLQLYFELVIKSADPTSISPKNALPPFPLFALSNFDNLLKTSLQKFKSTPLDSLADALYNDLQSQVPDEKQKVFLKFLIDIFLLTTPSTEIFQDTVKVPSIPTTIPSMMEEIVNDFKKEQKLENETNKKKQQAQQEAENKKAQKEERTPREIELASLDKNADNKLKAYIQEQFESKSSIITDTYKLKKPLTDIHTLIEAKALTEKKKKKFELDKKLPVFPPERTFYKDKYREEYKKFLNLYKELIKPKPTEDTETPKPPSRPVLPGAAAFASGLKGLKKTTGEAPKPEAPKPEAPKPEAPKPEEASKPTPGIDYSKFSQGKPQIKEFLKTLTNDQLGSIDTDQIPTMKRGLILEEKQSRGMKGGRYTRTTLRRSKKTKKGTQRRK